MEIGKNIRAKRREKDMTQEELAEFLNVSVSAVSQWECGKFIPDVSIIPALCSVLEITADELLGMDSAHRQEKIRAIIDEADGLGTRGYLTEACDILEAGLKRYPNSFELTEHLMSNLTMLYYANREKNKAAGERAVELGERILAKSTDGQIRASAVQTLVGIYTFFGDDRRAEELVEQSVSIYQSREVLSADVYKGERGIACTQILLGTLTQLMYTTMMSNRQRDNGKNWLTDDELAMVHGKLLLIHHVLYENGDFGFGHWRMCDTETWLMRYHAGKSDAKNTLLHMRNAAHHAIEFVIHVEERQETFEHTSVLFRGKPCGSFSTNNPNNSAEMLRRQLAAQTYDFVRDTAEFREIMGKLEQYAGQWKKQ